MWSTILTAVIGFILFLLFVPLWGMYTAVNPPFKLVPHFTPADHGLAYEDITLKTQDGISLSGWFIPNENADANAIILLHGYPAEKGDILSATAFLAEDHHLLYFDFRGLGKSGGTYTTIGALESEDLKAAVQYLEARGIERFGLWGFSMGGAVALMSAPDLANVQAIVADSSYASLDVMASELYRLPLLRHALGEMTNLWGWAFFGIHPRDVSPMRAARNIDVPLLLIHSRQDDVISFDHAESMQKALSDKSNVEVWFRENALHGDIDDEYRKRIKNFFIENL